MSHPRQLITREAIHQELWGAGVHVDFEQGVNHTVKQLRAALGDDANALRATSRRCLALGTASLRRSIVVAGIEDGAVAPQASTAPIGRGVTGASARMAGCGRRPGHRRASLPVPCRGLEIPRAALPAGATLAVIPFEVVDVNGKPEDLGLSLADAVIENLSTGGAIRVRPVAATRLERSAIP